MLTSIVITIFLNFTADSVFHLLVKWANVETIELSMQLKIYREHGEQIYDR